MFIDMHTHTSGISWCCKTDFHGALNSAKEAGYDGIVVTNHYTKEYFTEKIHVEWIDKYISEWNRCIEYGKKIGLKVFRGIEVTYEYEPRVHFLV